MRVWNYSATGFSEVFGWYAYRPEFAGGVFVAVGDVNGDGVEEVITGAGPGGGPHVRIWSLGPSGLTELYGYWGYSSFFPGGVFVGAGDLDGDGVAEIVTGPGEGGAPRVRVWSYTGSGVVERASFEAYDPAFAGGVSVATGDMDGDGIAEIITGAGSGGGPHVRIWRLAGGGVTEIAGFGFFPYNPYFSGGVFVAAGDLDGDGVAELITGAGSGGGPHVRIWKLIGGVLTEVAPFGFFAYHPAFPGGAFVGR